MRFLAAIGVYAVMGLVLAAGVVLASQGTYWLLGLGAAGYFYLFARYGCWGR